MKIIALLTGLALSMTVLASPTPSPESKKKETVKVCVDQKDKQGKPVVDPKTGKIKQTCKDVKKHQKLEGTPVPAKK